MNYDARDYDVVQTGPASWAVQYSNGAHTESGFANKQLALEYAQAHAVSAAPYVDPETQPRNVVEAARQVEVAQNNLLDFINQNPLASAIDQQPLVSAITSATSNLNSFAAADLAARSNVSATNSYSSLDFQQQLRMADIMRTQRLDEAVQLRLTQATTAQQQEADAKAFAAESYYQSLSQTANQALGTSTASSTALSANNNNLFGNFFSNLTGGLSNIGGNLFGQITDLFGSVGSASSGGLTTGSGASGSNIGTSLADQLNTDLANGSAGSNTSGSTGSAERRVRLSPKPSQRGMLTGILEPLKATGGLVFPYTPQITYQGRATYNPLKTVHANQDWHIYQNTDSIQLTIQGEFTAQNKAEGEYLLAAIHFLRASTKMRFGDSDSKRGVPPPQLFLDGYGMYMFNGLSVIVTNYDVGLPNNVDYLSIEAGGGVTQVPIHTTISVECIVQQTPKKAREFDWDKFASGDLMKGKGWL